MNEVGQLFEADGRFEFRNPEIGLVVRGDHPEWVLQAAAEVIANTAKNEAESLVEEMSSLVEFEAATEIEVDSAKYAMKQRFENIPQCMVSLGKVDYRWAAPEGRGDDAPFGGHPMARVHDMSMTRGDSFLANENGVDTTNK